MNKHKRIRLYRMFQSALRCSLSFDYYEDEGEKYKRFIIDLNPGFLFGYEHINTNVDSKYIDPVNSKIEHSRLGLIFRSETECRCLDSELRVIYDQILEA